MRKILGLLVLVLSMSAAADAFAIPLMDWNEIEGTSEPQGVFCEINGVRLMAKTAEDCEKASGDVTHVISTTVTPAGDTMDNPNEEPEIQREKDKEPEAQ